MPEYIQPAEYDAVSGVALWQGASEAPAFHVFFADFRIFCEKDPYGRHLHT